MYTLLRIIADRLDRFAERTGHIISWLALAIVVITFAVVVLRYLFNTGSIALQESITYLHATLFMLGVAWTLKQDGHVRVDIFYSQHSRRTRAWTNLLGTLLLLFPVCIFILLSSLDYVAASWSVHEGSQEAGGLDAVFLLKTAIPAMAVLLMLQGFAIILRNLLIISGNEQPDQAT